MDMSRCWRSMSRIIRKLCSKVRRLCYNHFEDDDVEEALIINKESLRKLSSDHLNSDELRRDAHIWQNRTNELREEVRILKKQVKECVTEKDALYIGLKRAKEEMSELRAALRLQQDVLKERTAEIRAIQDQVRRRDARIGEYVQTIRDLQEQISVMKKQVQECIVYKEAMKKVGNEQREELSGESKSSTEQCPVKESENEGPDGEPQAAAQPGVTIKKLEHQTPSNRPDSSQDTSRKSFADELAPGVTLLQRTNTDYRSFCEAYDLGPMVARGSFGQVFAATRKSDKLPVAVKFIKRARGNGHMQHPDDPEAVPMEVATMRAVCAPPSCPWIIQLLDWYCGSSKTLLVLERPKQCMSLSEFARNNRWRLSEKQSQSG
ncbi:uncharacterized protein LOC120543319 [Polypterus senegalus]|uniref:uncharacterized protein LOC120543319 n=1 Tax=Polypterus senegalus TaxID=55291 RepID=UPI001965C47C|nr:uncharacterized protein LOC120543319 [Polypterus senegalus]